MSGLVFMIALSQAQGEEAVRQLSKQSTEGREVRVIHPDPFLSIESFPDVVRVYVDPRVIDSGYSQGDLAAKATSVVRTAAVSARNPVRLA